MTKTVLRYAGGKSRAIKHIDPYLEDYDFIVSPFIGGGSLEVHWASQGKKVFGYDVFDILVTFWQTLLKDPAGLANKMKTIWPGESSYRTIKEILMRTPQVQNMIGNWGGKDYYKRNPEPLDDLTLSAYYYFNHNCSYGPGFLGWWSSIYGEEKGKKWFSMIEKIESFSCPTLKIDEADFKDVIPAFNKDMLYLDPPYFLPGDRENNKMHSGIYPMKNFPVHHDKFDHELLRDLLKKHNGPFVLSYNDCPEIRSWYSEFDFHYPEWHYSLGQGEVRLGKNRKETEEDVGIKCLDKLETKLKGFVKNSLPKKTESSKIDSIVADIKKEVRNVGEARDSEEPFLFEEAMKGSEKIREIFLEHQKLNKYIPALSGFNEKKSHEILIVKK